MSLVYRSRLGVLLVLFAVAAASSATVRGQESPEGNWRFGVIESYESPEHAARLGVGWTRVIFHWGELQAGGAESWSPRVDDERINAELEDGRMVVGLIIGIPDWAREDDLLPTGLWLPFDHPDNSWSRFVTQLVNRYEGRIDHWIIWNEPDIRKGAIAHSWDGSVADFAQLQRVAYLAAKEANPRAVIHLPAFTYWADFQAETEQYMALLLDEIRSDPEAAAHNYYFDVATAHLYFQPNQVFDLLGIFQEIMRERGMQQPIWLVETNAPPRDDPEWPVDNWTLSVTLQEQATYMPQALAVALAAGAERIAVYKLKDTQEDKTANPEPFGLVRADNSERPAFTSFRLAVQYLGGAVSAERQRWDAVGQIRVNQANQFTTVLFSRLPEWQLAEIPAVGDSALLVDMWGTKQAIQPEDGMYQINLAPANCSHTIGDYCMIGGPTYYLIQMMAETSPTPSPAQTDTPNPTATQIPQSTQTPSKAPTEEKASAETPQVTDVALTATASPTASVTEQVVASRSTPGVIVAADTSVGSSEGVPTKATGQGGWFPVLIILLLVVIIVSSVLVRKRDG